MSRVSHRYEILDVLGHGSTGIVHLAWDRHDRRFVAAKVLRGPTAEEIDHLRFLEEQRVRPDHPRVVATLDWYQAPDEAVLVMELAEHGTLSDVLALNDTVPAPFVELVALDLLEAVAYLHGVGVVHRDIKPGNVLLTEREGVVSCQLGDLGSALVSSRPRLTQDGTVGGTLGFTAPEVLRGDDADQRSDVWAVGATIDALIALADEPVTPEITALCRELGADDPDERPTSGDALTRLRRSLDPESDGPPAVPVLSTRTSDAISAVQRRRRRGRTVRALGVVGAAAALGLAAVAWPREISPQTRSASGTTTTAFSRIPGQELLRCEGEATGLMLSDPPLTSTNRVTKFSLSAPSEALPCTGSLITSARLMSLVITFPSLGCASTLEPLTTADGDLVVQWSDGTTSAARAHVTLFKGLRGEIGMVIASGRFAGSIGVAQFGYRGNTGGCEEGLTSETVAVTEFNLRSG